MLVADGVRIPSSAEQDINEMSSGRGAQGHVNEEAPCQWEIVSSTWIPRLVTTTPQEEREKTYLRLWSKKQQMHSAVGYVQLHICESLVGRLRNPR